MSVRHTLHAPSIAANSVERAAAECAIVWRRFQETLPPFAALPNTDISRIEKFVRAEKGRWEHILVLGIGGSSLGAQTIVEGVLGTTPHRRTPHVHFLDNVDPIETTALLKHLPLKKTLTLVITKSGGTLETMASFFLVKEKLGKTWQKNIVAITDPTDGFLRELAEREKLTSFDIPKHVGGRFSVLSECGLVPAALAGVKIRDLLAGAREVQAAEAFHFALVAAELYLQKRNITVFCPYARNLKRLGEWYAQLLAESVGKRADTGLTPEVSLGATDQHSKLQLWHDGPDDKFFLFFGIEKFARDAVVRDTPPVFTHLKNRSLGDILAAELAGTTTSLREKGRPLALFELPDLSARSLGFLLQFFMLEVAFLGEILGVNPYNQPGVERGKIVTKNLLGKMRD